MAIALPWLEIMRAEEACAAAAPARRLVTVFTPGGSVLETWQPSGSETAPVLSSTLSPLEAVKDRVLILSGVDMPSAVGESDQSGLIAWLTAMPQENSGGAAFGYPLGPSIDQVLAPRLSKGMRLPSLQLAVRWGTGKAHGKPSPIDIANYADTPSFDPIAPRIDPQQVWQDLFGTPPPSTDDAWDKSILDAVGQRYQKLSSKLGSVDRKRVDAHLQSIRELEQTLSKLGHCQALPRVDTTGYNPNAGLCDTDCSAYDSGTAVDAQTDAMIPTVGKFMLDMLVMALACDLTAVASFQWGDAESKYTFPWLGLNEHLHFYMNDGGYHPNELSVIGKWHVSQHAYLIQKMKDTVTESGSLLDESVVFFGSNVQNPATHSKQDLPFLLAGNGGGLKTGRWLKYSHASHSDLLVALLNLCGDPRTSFGTAKYCTGPLARLT